MKQYKTVGITAERLSEVRCNVCGRRISPDSAHPYQDYLSIEKEWGYDSPYDGERHQIDVCSACYRQWLTSFVLPPAEEEETAGSYESEDAHV